VRGLPRLSGTPFQSAPLAKKRLCSLRKPVAIPPRLRCFSRVFRLSRTSRGRRRPAELDQEHSLTVECGDDCLALHRECILRHRRLPSSTPRVRWQQAPGGWVQLPLSECCSGSLQSFPAAQPTHCTPVCLELVVRRVGSPFAPRRRSQFTVVLIGCGAENRGWIRHSPPLCVPIRERPQRRCPQSQPNMKWLAAEPMKSC
jgi:hypothetical protein